MEPSEPTTIDTPAIVEHKLAQLGRDVLSRLEAGAGCDVAVVIVVVVAARVYNCRQLLMIAVRSRLFAVCPERSVSKRVVLKVRD